MRIQRVLVGMDFSAPAIAGARWAARYFTPGAELVLAHVSHVLPPPVFARGVLPDPEVIRDTEHEFSERRLRELAAELAPATVRWVIRDGRPSALLTTLAMELEADLIVIGPHGDRPRPRKMLGTTAERVVRGAHVPVVVAANAGDSAPRRILAAVDESQISHTVLWWTEELARAFDAKVVVFSVVDDAAYAHDAAAALAAVGPSGASAVVESEIRDAGVRWLHELGARTVSPERFSASVTFGKPGDAILAAAAERNADLIVMGRHGTGALMSALLGSTLGIVLHGAPCPVFVATETEDTLVDEPE